jgi:ubiquinone/menaquinone biosynthesis C-methylase UbiE
MKETEGEMSQPLKSASPLPSEALAHYEGGIELPRLARATGQLELVRTQELLVRYLPSPPAVLLDVGGGPGVYACWLAQQGYEVHLIDAVPLHIEQATRASQAQPEYPIASMAVGDARKLERPAESADAVLLLGPLYHLTDRHDRVTALREARRVLRPGGVVCGVGISRFTSLLDGLVQGFLDDSDFVRIVERDLTDGQHRNPTNHPFYFTTAFFHDPADLKAEMEEAGLSHRGTLGIEGPGWLLQNFAAHWENPGRREHLLRAARTCEQQPSMLGLSAHLMAVGGKDL